ncbi:MAG: serine hydrolase [Thermoflexales bacterium]
MKRRIAARQGLELAALAVLAIVVIFLGGNAVSFVADRNRLPATTFISDIDVSGLNADDAISRTVRALSEPVALSYAGEAISLDPGSVEVRLNQAVARLQIDQILRQKQSLDQFPGHILRKTALSRIPAPIVYSESRLSTFLLGLAARFDREPGLAPAGADGSSAATSAGRQLNFVEARDALIGVLARANERKLSLPIDVVGGGAATVRVLEPALRQQLATFVGKGGVASIYIKNLRGGDELSINADSALSAQGWLKMLAVLEAIRAADAPLSGSSADNAVAAIVGGSASDANALLRTAGAGEAQTGVQLLNGTLRKLGLLSTFLAQPFDQQSAPATVVTPANLRALSDAVLDRNAQSTAAEIGAVFEALAACRADAGAFPVAFPKAMTRAKCEAMLNLLARNSNVGLIDANVAGAAVFHRQSWDANTHADAALVTTRDADYVLVISLSQSRGAMSWADSSVLIGSLTRATHAFLNGGPMPAASAALKAPPLP